MGRGKDLKKEKPFLEALSPELPAGGSLRHTFVGQPCLFSESREQMPWARLSDMAAVSVILFPQS